MRNSRSVVLNGALLYPLLLIGLSALHLSMPRRSGVLALTQIFAPHLFLAALLLLPLALYRGAVALRLALLACAILYGVRFVPGMLSLQPEEVPDAIPLTIMTWNVLYKNQQQDDIRHSIQAAGTHVVALQELTAGQADAIAQDAMLAQRYPHRALRGHRRSTGMGLLSTYPILEVNSHSEPPLLWARLDLGEGNTIIIVNAHPMLRDLNLHHFDASARDRGIMEVRALLDPLLREEKPVLVVGDFNVTEREPAYGDLTIGLQDAHVQVGVGSGNTWRPEFSQWLPFGLLRIDYLLSSPAITPLRTSVDCLPRGSDHCIVQGEFGVKQRVQFNYRR